MTVAPSKGHAYGTIRDAVAEWVREFPAGREFYYGDLAEDLGIPLPTASGTLLKMVRAEQPVLVRSTRSGWYRKLAADTPAEPEAPDPKPAKSLAAVPGPGDLLEVVGSLKSGNLLLRAENGKLYNAEEM